MAMPPIAGHEAVRTRLAQARLANRLPQVLLIEGDEGVGRQRLGLWLGQLLLCSAPDALGPCGACRACRLVSELSHPDLHWFVPVPRPKAADPDKAVDEVAELLAEVMGERRSNPLYGPPDGMASHSVASVRLLQRRAALTSVEGGPKVFVLGHAERLVPQESSQEAANALLKILEEPPPATWFLLTATDARRLLPTIRSRVVPVRLGRLADAEVRRFLAEHGGVPAAELDDRVRQAEGAIGLALTGGGERAKAYDAAGELLAAVMQGGPVLAERVLRQGSFAARGDFSAMLDALADTLGEAARASAGERPRRPLPEALRSGRSLPRLLEAQRQVQEARDAAFGNVNPQLLLAELGEGLSRCLAG